MPMTEASALRTAKEIGAAVVRDAEFAEADVEPGYNLVLRVIHRGTNTFLESRLDWGNCPSAPLLDKLIRSEYADLKKRLRDEIAVSRWMKTKTA